MLVAEDRELPTEGLLSPLRGRIAANRSLVGSKVVVLPRQLANMGELRIPLFRTFLVVAARTHEGTRIQTIFCDN